MQFGHALPGETRRATVEAHAILVSSGNEPAVAGVESALGKIDILIPNAGLALMRTLEQTEEGDFQRTMDLNVKGPYFLAQVNTSSSRTY